MYDYLDTVTPDYTTAVLSVTPTEVLEEEGEFRQIVHTMDDGTEAVVSLSTKRWFWVTLQWDYRPEADAGTIMDFYFDTVKAYGMARSFYWQHPRDGHTYVVKFADKLRRAHHAWVVDHLSVRGMRLRVIGRKLDA
jgi:hypothetical protein